MHQYGKAFDSLEYLVTGFHSTLEELMQEFDQIKEEVYCKIDRDEFLDFIQLKQKSKSFIYALRRVIFTPDSRSSCSTNSLKETQLELSWSLECQRSFGKKGRNLKKY